MMTIIMAIAGAWVLAASVFCLALCRAAGRPLPSMPVTRGSAKLEGLRKVVAFETARSPLGAFESHPSLALVRPLGEPVLSGK